MLLLDLRLDGDAFLAVLLWRDLLFDPHHLQGTGFAGVRRDVLREEDPFGRCGDLDVQGELLRPVDALALAQLLQVDFGVEVDGFFLGHLVEVDAGAGADVLGRFQAAFDHFRLGLDAGYEANGDFRREGPFRDWFFFFLERFFRCRWFVGDGFFFYELELERVQKQGA